ncbi:MAG: RT0821/Lpp0805 family surface protein [Pseudomonadota bacterium]
MAAVLRAITLVVCLALLSACASDGRPIGTVVQEAPFIGQDISRVTPSFNSAGAVVAYIVVALVVLLIIATLNATFEGEEIVGILPEDDQEKAGVAYTRGLLAPSGTMHLWYNPENGNGGTVTGVKPAFIGDDAVCREFRHQFHAAGQLHKEIGIACRENSGRWRLIESPE